MNSAEEAPKEKIATSVLLVHCSRHCRLEDLSLAEEARWLRGVSYESAGVEKTFKKGQKVGTLLRSFREARRKNADAFERVRVWGQPAATMDVIISR